MHQGVYRLLDYMHVKIEKVSTIMDQVIDSVFPQPASGDRGLTIPEPGYRLSQHFVLDAL